MIYIFDTSSIRTTRTYYPKNFGFFWDAMDQLVKDGRLLSTAEAKRELLEQQLDIHLLKWIKTNKAIFTVPTEEETKFVAKIFEVAHFQQAIGQRQRLKGMPVADPFIVSAAKVRKATVVTEEVGKANSAKIPTICKHFGIQSINLQKFMDKEGIKSSK